MVKREISVQKDAAGFCILGASHEKETVFHGKACVFFGNLNTVGIFFYGLSASGTTGTTEAAGTARSSASRSAHHHRYHI
jgi:hypothetical protein